MEALRALEPWFWRAPSAHNTQPWQLCYGPDAAEIRWDERRALPCGDPTGRDLRLSLGAFAECCLIVCAGAGLAVDFRLDYSPASRRAGYLVRADAPYPTPFTASDVAGRQTSRVAYQPGPLRGEAAAVLRDLAAAAGGAAELLPCRDLAGLLHAADRHQFGRADVVAELRDWLRLTPRHPAYLLDGLTDRVLALRRAEAYGLRAVLSRGAYPVLRRAGLPRALAATARGLLDYDGQVAVLVAPPGAGPAGQITMGRVLLRQWLALSWSGYAAHPLSQLLDCPATRAALAERLGVTDPERLVSVYRAGRPVAPAARSARRVRLSGQVRPVARARVSASDTPWVHGSP